jgi:hypothetical protein
MYAGGLAAKEDAAKRQEEALLGQRAAPVLAGAPAAETVSRVRAGVTSIQEVSLLLDKGSAIVCMPALLLLSCEDLHG